MKKTTYTLLLLAALTNGLSSCLKSDTDDVTLYDDAVITSFTHGALNRYYIPAGSTSQKKVTISSSLYPMTIDQLGDSIFNVDPLPKGTDISHIVCTVTTKNSGMVGIKNSAGVFVYYNQADSLDFTQPRTFRVVSTDGTAFRDYKVSFNVSKTTGTDFEWDIAADTTLFTNAAGLRIAVLPNHRMLVAKGKDAVAGNAATSVIYASSDTVKWDSLSTVIASTPITFTADAWQSLIVKGDSVYMLNGNSLMRSADGTEWTVMNAAAPIKKLLAGGSRELFAMGTCDSLMSSRDCGQTWMRDSVEEFYDPAMLPVSHVACAVGPFATSPFTDHVLLIGRPATAPTATPTAVWRKVSHYAEAPAASQWTYIPVDYDNTQTLPELDQPSLVAIDNRMLALDNKGLIYQTRDQGITWQKASLYALPSLVTGNCKAMTIDADGTLWLVSSDGSIWSGQLR